jgi:hypothetical protein
MRPIRLTLACLVVTAALSRPCRPPLVPPPPPAHRDSAAMLNKLYARQPAHGCSGEGEGISSSR